jgi:hypothetical protein
MQTFFSRENEFGSKIAIGIIMVAILGSLAVKGFETGRWLATRTSLTK